MALPVWIPYLDKGWKEALVSVQTLLETKMKINGIPHSQITETESSSAVKAFNIGAWTFSWWYYFFDHDQLDYSQILSDFGAILSPHIIGIGKTGQAWRVLKIKARVKAMKRLYGGPPTDFIPYGRLVGLNPRFVVKA